jgi:hypothetical protein
MLKGSKASTGMLPEKIALASEDFFLGSLKQGS